MADAKRVKPEKAGAKIKTEGKYAADNLGDYLGTLLPAARERSPAVFEELKKVVTGETFAEILKDIRAIPYDKLKHIISTMHKILDCFAPVHSFDEDVRTIRTGKFSELIRATRKHHPQFVSLDKKENGTVVVKADTVSEAKTEHKSSAEEHKVAPKEDVTVTPRKH